MDQTPSPMKTMKTLRSTTIRKSMNLLNQPTNRMTQVLTDPHFMVTDWEDSIVFKVAMKREAQNRGLEVES